MKNILLCAVLFTSFFGYSADYFWVGNSGNWSDLTHWASVSGGAGNAYGVAPTSADNVFFDANSFSAGGQTVTIDVDAVCADLDFSGVSNAPTISSAATEDIDIHGNLILIGALTWNHSGDINLRSTGPQSITSAGHTFGQDVLCNGVGGIWTLTDPFAATGELGIQNGTIDFAGFAVSLGSINANLSVNARSLNFAASAITITGSGTSLDLRGDDVNFSIIDAGATITFTNAADITVETGDEVKTIPNMIFTNVTNQVQINTGGLEDNAKRITFGNITVSQDGCGFRVDGNNDDNNIKTYGTITLPADCDYIMGSADGTGGYAGTNHTIIGSLIVGDNGDGTIRGRFLEFAGAVDLEDDSDCNFTHETRFQSTFNVASTRGNRIIINNDAEFNGLVTFEGDCEMRLDIDIDFNAGIAVGANGNAVLDHNGGSVTVDIIGGVSIGTEATMDFGDGDAAVLNIDAVTVASEGQFDINNGAGATTIGNINLTQYNIVRFNTGAATTITGTLTSAGDCSIWLWLKSLTDGVQASVAFSAAQGVTSNLCQDINCTTSNLTNTSGVDLSNNIGITFPSSTAGLTFFWVGSTTGNTKTGTFTTGVNDDWSNPDNWATASGTYTGTNQCIPGAHDNVIFDANSFSAGAGTVNLDLIIQACNDMTWTGIPAGCTFDAGVGGTARDFFIYGNATLHANLDNQYEGPTTFSAHDATVRTIDGAGSNFFGNVIFDFTGGNWGLSGNVDMNGEQRADLILRNGTFDGNTFTLTLEDDWTVQAGGTFVADLSTIIFDGPASQNSRQEITSNGDAFYNLHVNRGTNGGGANDLVRTLDPITVNNDLLIQVGSLEDRGNQITGNATGLMQIENGARIVLGMDNLSTLFPTNYITANIDLHEAGQTRYNSDVSQTISSVPDYGRLYLTNNAGALVPKTLDGPITINDLFFIDNFQHFIDAGFQVTGDAGEEIQMDPDSRMTLGTAATATQFPTNFTVFDLNQPSTVVYNSGVAQTIKGINGGGDASYDFLTITNAAGAGNPTKTLDANAIIRSDFTINTNNTVDVDAASDFDIELQGNWINSGTFVEQEGTVSFTGTAGQTMTSGGTVEGFYDFVINNTNAAGLIINDDVEISNSGTFTDGIIFEGSNEIVEFFNGATVSGAKDASHVDGRVEKTGTDAFDFPVGDLGVYQPVSISAPAVATTTFRAEYFNFDPAPFFDDTQLDPSIHHVSDCEHWVLDKVTPAADPVSVTLAYKSHTGACSGVTDPTSLVVARWDGALWQNEGGPGAGAPVGSVTSAAPVANFSPFTLASTTDFPNNPLPVDLLSWDVNASNDLVIIDWSTATETNNSHFTIEKSSDQMNFKEIEIVEGAGNSSTLIDYMTTDRSPNIGWNYYRLSQTDFNGDREYFGIKSVYFSEEGEVSIYPNPSTGQVELNLPYERTNATIYDAFGRLVLTQEFAKGKSRLNLNHLSAGEYFIKLISPNHVENKTLVLIK